MSWWNTNLSIEDLEKLITFLSEKESGGTRLFRDGWCWWSHYSCSQSCQIQSCTTWSLQEIVGVVDDACLRLPRHLRLGRGTEGSGGECGVEEWATPRQGRAGGQVRNQVRGVSWQCQGGSLSSLRTRLCLSRLCRQVTLLGWWNNWVKLIFFLHFRLIYGDNKCPVCRKEIISVSKAYISWFTLYLPTHIFIFLDLHSMPSWLGKP